MAFDRGGNEEHIATIQNLVKKERNHQLLNMAKSIVKSLREGGESGAQTALLRDLCAGDQYKRNGY